MKKELTIAFVDKKITMWKICRKYVDTKYTLIVEKDKIKVYRNINWGEMKLIEVIKLRNIKNNG